MKVPTMFYIFRYYVFPYCIGHIHWRQKLQSLGFTGTNKLELIGIIPSKLIEFYPFLPVDDFATFLSFYLFSLLFFPLGMFTHQYHNTIESKSQNDYAIHRVQVWGIIFINRTLLYLYIRWEALVSFSVHAGSMDPSHKTSHVRISACATDTPILPSC